MEREAIINIAEAWIAQLKRTDQILEGFLVGSVLREKDFQRHSDVDVVLLKKDALPFPDDVLSKLQFKIEHPLEVIVYHPEQLQHFSPCHRKSNFLMQIARERPQSLIGAQLGLRTFFQNEFQIFWRWHSYLRIIEIYGRDKSHKTYGEQLKTYAARSALVEQYGYLKFQKEKSLYDSLSHWTSPWWSTPQDASEFVLQKLTQQASLLSPFASEIIPTANEDWLIREFWDERARLTKINRLGDLVQFLMEDAVILKMKIDKACS